MLIIFLLTADEINWSKKNGVAVGIGRGSAGGCLVSYFLDIIHLDPIKWDLMFERFLIPERAGLAPDTVTIIADDISSKEYIRMTLENGKEYMFDKDAEFRVKRGDDILTIYADELLPDDDIIFDNKNLLFDL